MSAFVSRIILHSSHCGPQGRLQTGRYFELTNRIVEEWFGGPLAFSFADMHHDDRRMGIPTVRFALEVHQAAYLGEELQISLQVDELRRSAIELTIKAHCNDQPRFTAVVVLVLAERSSGRLRGMAIPPELRAAMAPYLGPSR